MRTAARRRVRPCVARWRSTCERRSFSARTRSPRRRRSVSSCFSPGPRRPMPPFCRSRWVQPPTRRVSWCLTCASSTWSLPSALRARRAKMSRMRLVRSTTRHSSRRSRLRCCAPVSVWLKITRSARGFGPLRRDLFDLALAGVGGGVGALASSGDHADDGGARRHGERVELGHPLGRIGVAEVERDQQRAVAAAGTLKHRRARVADGAGGRRYPASAAGGAGRKRPVKLRRRSMGRCAASRPSAPERRSRSRACTPSA